MTKKRESGDVHAPVEDTDVPFGLKVLVVIMLTLLVGMTILLAMTANELGLFRLLQTPAGLLLLIS